MGIFGSCSGLLLGWLLWSCIAHITALGNDDPLSGFQIDYPQDGGLSTVPLRFKFTMFNNGSSVDALKARYGDMFICVELEGVSTNCSPVMGAKLRFQELAEGSYVARAYIWDAEMDERYRETNPLSFSIVNAADFGAHTDQLVERYRVDQEFPPDLNILQWAEQLKQESFLPQTKSTCQSGIANDSRSNDVFLVIGVKSAVITNFARRQAIRETWASKAAQVKVFFLGCTPNLESIPSHRDRLRLEAAIELEKAVYGDLLTGELECEDSHSFLAEKVASFLGWVVAELPQTQFVMIADDDIYVRVNFIVKDLTTVMPHKRLYLGELANSLHPRPYAPVRIASDSYYTSKLSYPMEQFVPYAAGPHFVLSMDCVRFIARNRRHLASLNGHDDTSIALWLLTIQVHVQRTSALISYRFIPCEDNVLSIADLSPLAIRSIHANLLHNRTLCHGFDRLVWEWKPPGSFMDILDPVSSGAP
ncbi:Hydroxyproline O-galactosyltransferase GALT2 [Phytophthora ramorum]|uniref:Hydroxyproline O-galactosyltransferase GALT2 n=1 Tax=Phytophthora ramorum TaxID=164328 RepID=UPI0030AA164B|nr:Hydroxyproline O-galactosyltransferase GALT2 [Phytophthora ramorum]